MLLIDASIQMGQEKCLIVLGLQSSKLRPGVSLTLKDFEPLALKITDNLNGDFITQTLEEVSESVKGIDSICRDKGSEMVLGCKNFQMSNPKTKIVSDTAHRIGNFLEARLKKSERWKSFRKDTTQSRRKMQNSKVSGNLPPSPRLKARFMNVGGIIHWGKDELLILDHSDEVDGIDTKELSKYLDYLPEYREDIEYWNRLVLIGEKARHIVREEHIHAEITENFLISLEGIPLSPRELSFVDDITQFFLEQSHYLAPGERLLGTTEPLESMFSKLKAMEKEQTAFGFTSLVLASIACVGPIDENIVRDAIGTVKLKQIDEWSKKEIGKSIQSERRKVRSIARDLKEKMAQKLVGFIERKIA